MPDRASLVNGMNSAMSGPAGLIPWTAMPLNPEDATPVDGSRGNPTDAGAEQDAALRAHVEAVEAEPSRRGPTQVLIGLLQNMIVAAARGAGGSDAVRRAQKELEDLPPHTAREFTERVQQGYGRGEDADIGVLYCRFLAARVAETHAGYRRGEPRQIYVLLKMVSEALMLENVQEQRGVG